MRMIFKLDKYHIFTGIHKGKEVVWIRFPKDNILINQLKTAFPSAKWSATQKCWYLPDRPAIRERLGVSQKTVGKEALAKIHPVNRPAMEQMIALLKLKGYSPNTLT